MMLIDDVAKGCSLDMDADCLMGKEQTPERQTAFAWPVRIGEVDSGMGAGSNRLSFPVDDRTFCSLENQFGVVHELAHEAAPARNFPDVSQAGAHMKNDAIKHESPLQPKCSHDARWLLVDRE